MKRKVNTIKRGALGLLAEMLGPKKKKKKVREACRQKE